MGWEGICIRVHLISASLSSQAERNKEWEATKRIHGLVRKSFRAEHPAWMQSGRSHKVGLMWKKMAVTPLRGWERVKEGEEEGRRRGKKQREEKESGTPWSRKVVRWTEASLSCDSEWDERGFWQYNFVSSLLPSASFHPSALYTVFTSLNLIWPRLALLFWVDLLFAVSLLPRVEAKGKRKNTHMLFCLSF